MKCVYGWAGKGAGVRYVITKFSRLDSSLNFLTHGAPLRARFASLLDFTTMFTYSHVDTPLGQSERAYYLSYFINIDVDVVVVVVV